MPGQLDLVLVPGVKRPEVLLLKLALHGVHVQAQVIAGHQPERLFAARDGLRSGEQLRAPLLRAEHPRCERAAAGEIRRGGDGRIVVAGDEIDGRVGIACAQLLDERIERLRVFMRGEHVAGQDNRVKPAVAQREGEQTLVAAEGRALEIGDLQQGIAVEFLGEAGDRHSDARDVHKLIDGEIDGEERQREKKKRKGHPQCERLFLSYIEEVVTGRGGSEMRGMTRAEGVIARAALTGASVHRKASLTK